MFRSARGNFPLRQLCLVFLGIALWPEMELLVPSLPDLKIYFGVSEGQIQQLLSANFIGFICGVFFAGPLCDAYGRKRICHIGLALFCLCSLAAVFAPTFSLMVLARYLQGVAVTLPIIASLTVLMEITSGTGQVLWMSISSAAISFAMSTAPIFGSFINQFFGFRGNLWAIFFLAFFGGMPFIIFVEETLNLEKRTPFNIKFIAFSYKYILKNSSFMMLALISAALPAAFWVYSGVSSLYMVDYLMLDPNYFGVSQGLIVGSFSLASLLISFLNRTFGTKICICAGVILLILGLAGLFSAVLFNLESVNFITAAMMLFVAGMAPINAIFFPLAMNQLPMDLQGCGQSMVQALRLSLASIGTLTLSFSYHGPFLPVFIILLILFCLAIFLLPKALKYA